MFLKDQLESRGNWLFKYRSYLPLFLIFVIVIAFIERRVHGNPISDNWIWDTVCFIICLIGLFVRIIAIGYSPKRTSGRNTKSQIADTLNTTGIYSTVRHPLYLGNYIVWLGIALSTGIWWVAVIFSLAFWVYYERIMIAEEAFLKSKFGEQYTEWCDRTPAFLPNLKKWETPSKGFNRKKIIRREFIGLYSIIVSFLFIDFLRWICYSDENSFSMLYLYAAIISTGLYYFLKLLKKMSII